MGVGRWFGWYGEATFGRIVLLFLFNEIVLVGGGWLMDGRWTRSWRLRALLLLSAVFASLTPQIASFGSGAAIAGLPAAAAGRARCHGRGCRWRACGRRPSC